MDTLKHKGSENLKHFKKGHPGGPGRPKGSPNITSMIRSIVFEEIPVYSPEGKKEMRPVMDQLIRAVLKPIINEGKIEHFREIMNRLEGLPKQTIDQNTSIDWKPDLSILSDEQLDELYKRNQLGDDEEC